MNIFEENKQYRIEKGVLLNDKKEVIAHCSSGVASPPKSLNIRLVRAKEDSTWDGHYIPAGTITKINYNTYSWHSWRLLVNGVFIPFYKDELERYFEPVND